MRTVFFFSIAAAVVTIAACDDTRSTTAPATAVDVAPRSAQAGVGSVTDNGKAPPPPPQPVGFTKVIASTSTDAFLYPGNIVTHFQQCPAGTTAIGGGYEFLTDGNPSAPPVVSQSIRVGNSWYVRILNMNPAAWSTMYRVTAYCAS